MGTAITNWGRCITNLSTFHNYWQLLQIVAELLQIGAAISRRGKFQKLVNSKHTWRVSLNHYYYISMLALLKFSVLKLLY